MSCRMRWSVVGYPRVPWEACGIFDGVSEFRLDSNGKIYEVRSAGPSVRLSCCSTCKSHTLCSAYGEAFVCWICAHSRPLTLCLCAALRRQCHPARPTKIHERRLSPPGAHA